MGNTTIVEIFLTVVTEYEQVEELAIYSTKRLSVLPAVIQQDG